MDRPFTNPKFLELLQRPGQSNLLRLHRRCPLSIFVCRKPARYPHRRVFHVRLSNQKLRDAAIDTTLVSLMHCKCLCRHSKLSSTHSLGDAVGDRYPLTMRCKCGQDIAASQAARGKNDRFQAVTAKPYGSLQTQVSDHFGNPLAGILADFLSKTSDIWVTCSRGRLQQGGRQNPRPLGCAHLREVAMSPHGVYSCLISRRAAST